MTTISNELLNMFKKSIGDLTPSTDLDEYYKEKLETAYADFLAEDISESQLASELGQKAVVYYAKVVMNGGDIATDPTILLHRTKLAQATKGERYGDV